MANAFAGDIAIHLKSLKEAPVRIAVAGAAEYSADDLIGDSPPVSKLPGQRFNIIGDIPGVLDILLNLLYCPQGKLSVFIYRTEKTLIPRAITSDP